MEILLTQKQQLMIVHYLIVYTIILKEERIEGGLYIETISWLTLFI